MKFPFFNRRKEIRSTPVSKTRTVSNSIATTSSDFGGGGKVFGGLDSDGIAKNINSSQMTKNARIAYSDSIQARAIVDRNADVVVDVGIKIRPTCNASILGLSEEEAELWNQNIAERFDLYLGSRQCHRARTMTGYEAQRLFQISSLTDNDMFTRFYFENEPDAMSPVSFEFIDPLRIEGDGITSTNGQVNTCDGIKRDHRGREIAYMVNRIKPNGDYESVEIPAMAGDRYIMYHGFVSTQVSQLRGFSQFGHILQEFQDMSTFTKANIDKAITQASYAFAVTNEGEEDPSNPWENDVTKPAGKQILDSLKSTGLSSDEKNALIEQLRIDRLDNFTNNSSGSINFVNLKAKDKITPLNSSAPVTNYDRFVDAFTTHMAASARMPVEVLLMKFGQNYSASRAALIMFYRVAEIFRRKIDTDFLTPLYYNWLYEEIVSGRVSCPGWSDPVVRHAWLNHDIVAAPVPNIDPLKTALSKKEEISIGASDYDRAAQEINGTNGKANRAAIKRQMDDVQIPYWEKDHRSDDSSRREFIEKVAEED